MKLNHNDAAVRADSINARTGPNSGEIDLYAELTAFAELSPNEQMRLVDRPEKTSTEPEKTSAEEVEEKHPSPEAPLAPAPIEPVEAEKTPAETERISAEKAEKHPSPEPVLALAPREPVEATATALLAESASDAADKNASVERSKVRPEMFVRPSGPLGSLTRDFIFTGALSRGVCLACGAESDADDLFCITCGVFIDEIGSTLPVKPTCAECKQGISPDEIFCPWCGAVLPVA